MKILHVTDRLPGYHKSWGGAEKTCQTIIKYFYNSGKHESVAATTPFDKGQASDIVIPVRTMANLLGFRLPFDPLVYWQMRKLLKQVRPDIIHLHRFTHLSFAVVSAAKKQNIPVVMSIYDYWLVCPNETLVKRDESNCIAFQGLRCLGCLRTKNPLKMIFLMFRRLIFRHYIKMIDVFIVLSAASRDLVISYGIPKERIAVLPLSYESVENEAEGPVQARNILLIGWVQQRKGQLVLLAAMPEVMKKYADVKLWLIGQVVDNDYQKRIVRFISENDLSGNVEFLGRLSDTDFKQVFSQAGIIAVPEQWQNMSPVIILEAMAKGKLVLASRIGGIPEMIRDAENGLLAPPESPEEFAKKIIWSFENADKVEKIKARARQDVIEHYDGNKNRAKLEVIYESTI
ncbi:MAG: glycosyltransferase family 4 protein [Candidatus Margulisbacteria bacterium]|nr:glycosyltransferase family 4 protein [Candidatus Margulisiibacteriota bacterium]